MFMKNKDDNLQKAIDELLSEMETYQGDSPEYDRLTDQLTKLYSIKNRSDSNGISKDVLVNVGGQLLGIAMIVNFEKAGVVTSKALQFVTKLK